MTLRLFAIFKLFWLSYGMNLHSPAIFASICFRSYATFCWWPTAACWPLWRNVSKLEVMWEVSDARLTLLIIIYDYLLIWGCNVGLTASGSLSLLSSASRSPMLFFLSSFLLISSYILICNGFFSWCLPVLFSRSALFLPTCCVLAISSFSNSSCSCYFLRTLFWVTPCSACKRLTNRCLDDERGRFRILVM